MKHSNILLNTRKQQRTRQETRSIFLQVKKIYKKTHGV